AGRGLSKPIQSMIGFHVILIFTISQTLVAAIPFRPGGSFANIGNFLAQFDASTAPLMPWPETTDPSQTCPPASDPSERVVKSKIPIQFPDTPGCYEFKTPNYDTSGYPSAENVAYICTWVNSLPRGTKADGRIDGSTFELQGIGSSGSCVDHLSMKNLVNDNPGDDQDQDSDDERTKFCGSLSSDKIFTVEKRTFNIQLRANRARGGKGARIVLCF
ncbi:hypothetical protein TCAL_04670, partial [Tigriopus californicus]